MEASSQTLVTAGKVARGQRHLKPQLSRSEAVGEVTAGVELARDGSRRKDRDTVRPAPLCISPPRPDGGTKLLSRVRVEQWNPRLRALLDLSVNRETPVSLLGTAFAVKRKPSTLLLTRKEDLQVALSPKMGLATITIYKEALWSPGGVAAWLNTW